MLYTVYNADVIVKTNEEKKREEKETSHSEGQAKSSLFCFRPLTNFDLSLIHSVSVQTPYIQRSRSAVFSL